MHRFSSQTVANAYCIILLNGEVLCIEIKHYNKKLNWQQWGKASERDTIKSNTHSIKWRRKTIGNDYCEHRVFVCEYVSVCMGHNKKKGEPTSISQKKKTKIIIKKTKNNNEIFTSIIKQRRLQLVRQRKVCIFHFSFCLWNVWEVFEFVCVFFVAVAAWNNS